MKSILFIAVATLGLTAATLAQNVPSYVPTNGLVGWWPFNGNANDEGGNGNNGTVNGATLTADRFGNPNNAYYFNGNNNFINIPNSYIAGFGLGSFSSLAWFKINNGQSGTFVRYDNCISNSGWGFHAGGEYSIHGIEFSSTRVPNIISTSSAYNDNQWHMATFVRNTAIMKNQIYIDGYLTAESAFTTINQLNVTGSVLRFGSCGGFYYYIGDLDDIGIWNRALTQQEITNLYNATNCANNLSVSSINNQFQTGTTVVYNALTSDPNPSFNWQTDFGLGFQNLQNVGQYSGVNTDSLFVSNLQLRNHQQTFRVITTSGNCVDTSAVATISIIDTCLFTQYESVTTDTIRIVVTGINPPDYLNTIRVYPNPSTQGTELKIDFGDFATLSGYKLRIENAQGQQVFQTNIDHDNDTISQSVLGGTGIYLIRILDAQGNAKMTRKILIQ